MPKKDEPRIAIRLSNDEHARIAAVSKSQGVGVSTLLRECAVREDRFITVASQIATEKATTAAEKAAQPSAPKAKVSAPPAAPVPPAASDPPPEEPKPRSIAGPVDREPHPEAAHLPFKCPYSACTFRASSPIAICPHHGRRAIPV